MNFRSFAHMLCGAAFFSAAVCASASATTLSVPYQYPTIQAAVNAAGEGDTVLIADGTYTGDGNRDIDFGGKNLTVTSQNGAASTIMDCGGNANANHRGFYLHSGETSAVISGLTIQNGYETGNGGGMLNQGAGVTVQNCTLKNNTATGLGGGVFNFLGNGSALTLTGCTLTGNSANSGGGVYNYTGTGDTLTLTGCTILSNTANYAAGVYNLSTGSANTISLTACVLAGNRANFNSGGVYNNINGSGAISLTNCLIAFNAAAYYGGGGYNTTGGSGGGAISLTNCTMASNLANYGGGGLYNTNYKGAAITLTNDILYGDVTTYSWGGSSEVTVGSGLAPTASFCDIQGGYAGTGNLATDPQFLNAAVGDLHLGPGSPCVGAGTTVGAPTTSFEGAARPAAPSIGAYDVAAPVTAPIAAPTMQISGQVLPSGWAGAPQPLTFTLSVPGATERVALTLTFTPNTDGSFTLPNVPAGTYTLSVQGSHWLKKNISLDTTGGSVTGLSLSLAGGDADGDNQVNATDYLILRRAYGTALGQTGYDSRADFNGDGQVNATDYLILRRNYGKTGD